MIESISNIAEEYILLAHRLDKHHNGLVDAHYGMASECKKKIDSEQILSLETLENLAKDILHSLRGDVTDRANYLRKQTTALHTIIQKKRGVHFSYREEARLCFGIDSIETENEHEFLEIIYELEERLEGTGSLSDRFVTWRSTFELKGDSITSFIKYAMQFAKAKTESLFHLPENYVDVQLVSGKPWAGYHWYYGNYKSLYELNTDVPSTIWGVLHTTTHEAFCGHHTEAVVKELELVKNQGLFEFSINLLGTPCSTVSEGLAEASSHIIFGDTKAVIQWLRENESAHGCHISDNDAKLIELLEQLGRKPVINAALLMYDEHANDEEVYNYLRQYLPSEDSLIRRTISRLRDDDFRAYMLTYPIGKKMILNELSQSSSDAQTFYNILKSVDYQFHANSC